MYRLLYFIDNLKLSETNFSCGFCLRYKNMKIVSCTTDTYAGCLTLIHVDVYLQKRTHPNNILIVTKTVYI